VRPTPTPPGLTEAELAAEWVRRSSVEALRLLSDLDEVEQRLARLRHELRRLGEV